MLNQEQWVDQQWGTRGVHDPTIVQDGENYYMFSTDTHDDDDQQTSGVQIRISSDLIHWRYVGEAFDGVPSAAKQWSHAQGLWAPDVKKVDTEYRMYYSASTFGSRVSCIGLATAGRLAGPWQDQGIVIKTDGHQSGQNSIDAEMITDKDGHDWLVYGSFFGGIFITELDSQTGFTKNPGDFGTRIAQRPQLVQDGAIEGCFIYYNQQQDYYYLFMSYDSLTWSYNVRVARSKSITGPYLDMLGQNVCYPEGNQFNEIGTKILGSYQFENEYPWIAPGHNSIFESTTGQLYMVHHVRNKRDQNDSFGYIRRLYWLQSGWPVVSPNYISHEDEKILTSVVSGRAELIAWPATSEKIQSKLTMIDGQFHEQVKDQITICSYDYEQQCQFIYELGYLKNSCPFWLKKSSK